MAVTRCPNCLTLLVPGTEVCPCCSAALQQPKRRRKKSKVGKRNPFEFLWLVTAGVIVFVLLLQVVAWRGSARRAAMLAGLRDRPADESSLVIWPIIEKKYPDLRKYWRDRSGAYFVAVPELFWRSMHANEKAQLAADVDKLLGSQDWVMVTGPYLGKGQLAPRDRHARSAFFENEHIVPEPQPEFAASQLSDALRDAPTSATPPTAQTAPNVQFAGTTQEPEPQGEPSGIPEYEILFRTAADDPVVRSVFAEVLVPSLSQATSSRERRHIARTIADLEGLVDMALYCTREAREAHYSMDYAESHPLALAEGFLGMLQRGRFKPYKPQ